MTLMSRWVSGLRAPHVEGANLFRDVGRWLPDLSPRVVFDVGANVGDTTSAYLRHFPQAAITCFEPAQKNCDLLRIRFDRHRAVRVIRSGLGDAEGYVRLATGTAGDLCRVTDAAYVGASEDVPVTTLDAFCERDGVSDIDMLKIDTEGHDLRVLNGGAGLLGRDAIALLQVEAGMNPDNQLHVPLREFQEFLEPFGYRIFRLYEQMHEWPTRQPHLRRVDAVFMSRRLWNR